MMAFAFRHFLIALFVLLLLFTALAQSISIIEVESTDVSSGVPTKVMLRCSGAVDPDIDVEIRDAFTQESKSLKSGKCSDEFSFDLPFATYRAVATITDPGCTICEDADYFFVGLGTLAFPVPEMHPAAVVFVFLAVLSLAGKRKVKVK